MVVVQDQVNTTNPAEFDLLYSNSRAEAQAANPQAITDPEVSTTYGTATQMATAAKSAHADGIYVNATTSTISKTKSFLYLMQISRLLTPARPAWCPAALLRGTGLSGVRARGPIR